MPGMEDIAAGILSYYGMLKQQRSNYEERWQIIADHALGRRDFTTENNTQGRSRQRLVYDTTFQESSKQLKSSLQSLLIPEGSEWERVIPQDYDLWLENEKAREWYEDSSRRHMLSYADRDGGFYSQAGEMLSDVAAFSTGCIYEDWDDENDCIRWTARPLQEMFLDANPQGKIDVFLRRVWFTAKQAVETFGLENVNDQARTEYQTGMSGDRRFIYLHLIQRADRGVLKGVTTPVNHPWLSVYVGENEGKIVKDIGGFWSQPIFAPRWSTDPGENYGRGPGTQAITDATLLNSMMKTMIDAAQLAVRPPLMVVDNGVLNPVRWFPGGQNIIRAGVQNVDPIRPIDHSPRFDIGVEIFAMIKDQVRQAFYYHLLQVLDQKYMTATQTLEIAQRTAQLIGPELSHLSTDWLQPQSVRTHSLLSEHDKLMEKPSSIKDTPISITHHSPATRGQMAGDVQSLMAWVQMIMEGSQVNPDVTDLINWDEWGRKVGSALHIPESAIQDDDIVQMIREAKNAERQRQLELEETSQAAETAAKIAPALQSFGGGA